VLGLALAGYWATGSSAWTRRGAADAAAAVAARSATAAPAASASSAEQTGLQQIAAMVDALAERMKGRPDDAEGWTMLARSYTVLGRFADALPAYRRASELIPGSAGLLADYADAVAATRGTVNNPESIALLERALASDPGHPKALALAGTVAYDRADYAAAIAHWQKIADRLPPDSPLLAQVQASIAEARERAAGGAAPPGTPASRAGPARAAATTAAISGHVALDPALQGRAAPGDTVFVFARAASGPRMPLAVQRTTVGALPFAFRLDDSMAMAPNATLSGARSVIVGARISKTGNATPQPGDLYGESAPVAPGAAGVAIRIDKVVGSP